MASALEAAVRLASVERALLLADELAAAVSRTEFDSTLFAALF
jgi:hypothetical protein